MRHSRFSAILATAAIIAALVPALPPIAAQTAAPAAGAWNPPRMPDGQPDIQGLWQGGGGVTTYNIEDGHLPAHLRITGQPPSSWKPIVDPPGQRIPYQPWAAAVRKDIFEHHTDPPSMWYVDPVARGCFLEGIPRAIYQGGNGLQIAQAPGYVVMTFEFQHQYRVIPVDGRPHPSKNVTLWMGDSRGRWEDNTLVVDVTNNNDQTRFDIAGGIHTDALRVVERWTFADANTLAYEATIEDPNVFTQPWKIALRPFRRNMEPGYEFLEDACVEGNRSPALMLKRPGQ